MNSIHMSCMADLGSFLVFGMKSLSWGMHDSLQGMIWDENFYPIVVRELCQIKDCKQMRILFSLIRVLLEAIIEYHVNLND